MFKDNECIPLVFICIPTSDDANLRLLVFELEEGRGDSFNGTETPEIPFKVVFCCLVR
jgi:hypothetical protein